MLPERRERPSTVAASRTTAQAPSAGILRSPNLAHPGLIHGFSLRHGGVSTAYGGKTFNLGFTASDTRTNVERNRAAFVRRLAGRTNRSNLSLVSAKQIHSDAIHLIGENPRLPLTGDGLMTDVPGLLLAIQAADCLPVLLLDRRKRAVAALHAGWRGTVRRIVQKGVGRMRMEFGSDPEDIVAAIGPGIHACCYAVGQEVIEQFESQFSWAAELFSEVPNSNVIRRKYPLLFLTARAPGHSNLGPEIHLDLPAANRKQLIESGIPASNIWVSELCTSCRTDLLFSHRAEAGFAGRMMGVIGLAGHRQTAVSLPTRRLSPSTESA